MMVAGTGTMDYDGFVFKRGDLFYFEIQKDDKLIFSSEVVYKTEEDAMDALIERLEE